MGRLQRQLTKNERRVNDFRGALGIYVRLAESLEGVPTDTRDTMVRELVRLPVASVARMASTDVAAIFSTCIGLSGKRVAVDRIANLDGDELVKAYEELRDRESLPLAAKSGHPAEKWLANLLETPEGCKLYRACTRDLSLAWKQRELRRHLYNPVSVSGASTGERAVT